MPLRAHKQFGHGVAHRRTRSEYHAPATGQFIHIAALAEHITGLLGFRRGQTGDIAHFCYEKKVLKAVRLIHKQPVYTQFFKGNHIILALGGPQFFEFHFQLLAAFLHLLDGKFLPGGMFQLGNAALDLVDLFLDDALLPLK